MKTNNVIFIDIEDYKILEKEYKEKVTLLIFKEDDIFIKDAKTKVVIERHYKGRQLDAYSPSQSTPTISEFNFTKESKKLLDFIKSKKDNLSICYRSLSKLEKPVEDFLLTQLKCFN